MDFFGCPVIGSRSSHCLDLMVSTENSAVGQERFRCERLSDDSAELGSFVCLKRHRRLEEVAFWNGECSSRYGHLRSPAGRMNEAYGGFGEEDCGL